MDITEPRRAVSPKEAARLLGVSRPMIYRLIDQGELESFNVGACRRILVDTLDAFIGRQVEASRRPPAAA